jgi:hypothetical protein
MKTAFFLCAAMAGIVTFALAAETKKGSKKEAKPPSARDMVEKYDTNSDRKLDKTELHNALRSLKYNTFSTKSDSWKQFDTDKDEMLESKELDALLDANAKAQQETEEKEAKEAKAKEAAEKAKAAKKK